MEPEVSFVGVRLLPGKTKRVGGTANPESSIWTIHITQFALAAGAKPGKNTITLIQDNGESFALGTLEKDRCEQFQGDFMLSQEVQLTNHGKSEVHLTGYQTTTEVMDPEADLESDEDDDEEDLEQSLGQRRMAALKAMQASENGLPDEDDDSEEDEDFDEEDEEEQEDDDMIDDDDDDEVEAPEAVPLLEPSADKPRKAPKKGKRTLEPEPEDSDSGDLKDEEKEMLINAALEAADEDEDEDEDEEDSDVDLSDEEDSEEEEELKKASSILKQQKRSAETGNKAPQPNKKAKIEVQTPASTPTATDGDKQWSKAIKAYLTKEGATPISSLGSQVKKPPGVNRKLKKLLEEGKDFSLDDKGIVTLSS